MHVVYLLYFDSSPTGYIGITKNLGARLRQHRHDALRRCRNRKERWMKKYLEQGEALRYIQLAVVSSREEAVSLEQRFIAQAPFALANLTPGGEVASDAGIKALRRANRQAAKEYAIIKDDKLFFISGLSTFCRKNGLSHGNLHNVLKGKIRHAQGYLVFFKEDWDAFGPDKQQQILTDYWQTVAPRPCRSFPNARKPVVLYDGHTERRFDSVKDAQAYLGRSAGLIHKALNSEHKIDGRYSLSYL